jgi:preprotein translocase subunit SecD
VAKHYRPGRSLAYLLVLIVALGGWAFVPGKAHAPKLGLDLRGGTQVILSPKALGNAAITSDQLNQTVSIIRARVDGFGVAEAAVTTQGSGSSAKILVTIPGNTDRTVVDQLKSTAKLDFRPVVAIDYGSPQPDASASPSASASASATAKSTAKATASASPSVKATTDSVASTPSAKPSASASKSATPKPSPSVTVAPELLKPPIQSKDITDQFAKIFQALDCSTNQALSGVLDDESKYLITCDQTNAYKYVLAPALLTGTDISSATAGLPQQGAGGWQVDLGLTTDGAKKFATATKDLYQKKQPENQFGILLDGLVVSAPSVNEPILGGQATISGSFTADEAKALAQVLKYGALPISLNVDEVQQISPTLGADQLRAGLIAGGFGLLLVVLYLLLYYRALGTVAVASLGVAAAMTFFVFIILGREIKFTLTLAGITGAIVAIGITADSFIVYFERIRDELRDGKRLRSAAEHAWDRARRTILAADFVSFLAAVVLYYLSVGSVRGFAFTLGLTTLIDIGVAFMFTRPIVAWVSRSRWMGSDSRFTGVSSTRLGLAATREGEAS